MHVLIADNNYPRRIGITSILKTVNKSLNISEVSCTGELFEILRSQTFNRVLISASIAGNNLKRTIKKIVASQVSSKILLITDGNEIILPNVLTSSGINGAVKSNTTLGNFKFAIRMFIAQGNYFSEEVKIYQKKIFKKTSKRSNDLFAKLSPNERTVVEKLISGAQIAEISRSLSIASTTVSTYKLRAFQKLEISSISQLLYTIELSKKLA